MAFTNILHLKRKNNSHGLFFWVIQLLVTTTCFGQVFKNKTLHQLYQQKDYFKLQSNFWVQRKHIPPAEALFYEAILANAFNQSQNSNNAIARLRNSYPHWLTDSLRKALLNTEADNHIKLYQYARAAACYTEIINHYKAIADSTEMADIENSKGIWSAIANVRQQQVLFSQTTIVAWHRDEVGLIQMPVHHAADTCNLVFDTGANLSVITASAAKKLGMKTYPVKLDLASGTTGQTVQSSLAVADSLYLGNILIRNAVFLLLPDDMLYFKQIDYRQQGIIGEPIIAQLGEARIHANGTFEVPLKPSKRNFGNLALDGLMPIANFKVKQDSLPFRFDSGASSSVLYQPYFKKYKAEVIHSGTAYQLHTGGVGGTIVTAAAYTLKNIKLGIAGHSFLIPKINVRTTAVGAGPETSYGNMGLDIFGQFNTIIINFKHMYLEVL